MLEINFIDDKTKQGQDMHNYKHKHNRENRYEI